MPTGTKTNWFLVRISTMDFWILVEIVLLIILTNVMGQLQHKNNMAKLQSIEDKVDKLNESIEELMQ